jgi:Fur family peroxide stress response transcriptional regulator
VAVAKAELARRIDEAAETLRRRGLRVTHQRMEIFRELAATDEHPDAETVYQRVSERVPAVSRDTVYRTLATLEEHGLVSRAEILGGPSRYDADTEHHHHFVCTECGAVRDFRSPALDDLPIPRSAKAIGQVASAHVQVRGVCSDCLAGRAKRG